MSDRYHKAAKDGYLDLLNEATKKDLNKKDDGGMTPTLWAAYHGNLDALRLCCSRGGDPDKCDYVGNTALHFASANGHLNCLTFLVSFGANIWQMDNNYHTIMDVAAIREKHDCIKFLDGVIAKQNALDKKKVKGLQAKAKKDADKRIDAFEKMQKTFDKRKSQDNILRSTDGNAPPSERKKKISAGKLGWTFTGKAGPQRKTSNTTQPSGFTIGPTRQTLTGVQSEIQSDVMYGSNKTADAGDGGHAQGRRIRTVRDIFPESSQMPRDFQSGGSTSGTFGTMSSRNFGLNSMYSAIGNGRDRDVNHGSFNGGRVADSLSSFPTMSNYPADRLSDSDDEEFYRGIEEPSEIETFLASLNLSHLSNVFKQQRVDMELLMTLKEDDLKGPGMELVLGERKAILKAVEERKESLGMASDMELTQF